MQVLYTTQATVVNGRNGKGGTADGRLQVALSHPVIQPRPATGTDPEQLFAVGYAGCYGGACAFAAKQLGIELTAAPEVQSEVSLLKRDDGGFSVRVALRVTLTGVSQAQAEAIAAKGHTVCPYSHVLKEGVVTTEVVGVPAQA
ncbi:MAG: Ohr family peroxiredoxin [Alphaproteobacteria bacterium]|jgi:Ohr subfamily peroxiredoxin|nr:Ohr family peroxiredoxin [Alphaproteobacteria bacterium]